MLIFIVPILIVLGLVAIVAGRITFRRGVEPHCARCHHNLSGLMPLDRCPECGSDLAKAGAVDRGAPVRHTRLTIAGWVLSLLGIAMMLGNGYLISNPAAVMAWLPDWALAIRVNGSSRDRVEARLEFFKRVNAGEVSQRTIDRVVGEILTRQADLDSAWDVFWGRTIEHARTLNVVRDEDWHQYLQQATTVELRARSRVQIGDDVPVAMRPRERLGGLTVHAEYYLRAPATADWTIGTQKPNFIYRVSPGSAGRTKLRTSMTFEPDELGPHQVPVGIEVRVFDQNRTTLLTKYRQEHSVSIEVLAESSVSPAATSVTEDDLRSVLVVSNVGISGSGQSYFLLDWDTSQWKSLDVSIAFRVFLRFNGEEHFIGQIAIPIDGLEQPTMMGQWLPAEDSIDRIDIILRSDAGVASSTMDIDEYWDGEIIFKDVPFTDERKKE